MIMAGLWGLLDADVPTRRFPLVKYGRMIVVVIFSALILDNVTFPEWIILKRMGGWRTEKLDSFIEVLKQDLPDGIPGFGQDVPELYAYMDRNVGIHMTDWANLRFWKDSDSRPFEYASDFLKTQDFFFANMDDVYLVPAPLRGVQSRLTQLPGIIHAAVGGSIYLDDVGKCKVIRIPAHRALIAGVAVLWVLAVERLCKYAGAGGLARAP